MRCFAIVTVALSMFLAASAADAKGCLKGAAVGGVAGHVAGHHGLLGAAAGCAIGQHEANKTARQQQQEKPQTTGVAPRR